MLAIWLLASVAVLYLGWLFLLIVKSLVQEKFFGYAPRVTHFLPYIGNAIALGKDGEGTLTHWRSRYGNVFRSVIAGKDMTFVCDPNGCKAFLSHRSLSFAPVEHEASVRVFGILDETMNKMDASKIHAMYRTYLLHTTHLNDITRVLQPLLLKQFDRLLTTTGLKPVGLFTDFADAVMRATCEALNGSGFGSADISQAFREFDEGFPLLMGGVPMSALPKSKRAWKKLVSAFAEHSFDSSSTLVQLREEYFTSLGIPPQQRACNHTAIVWAALGNTIPAACWALLYTITSPEALALVQAEVDQVSTTEGLSANGALSDMVFSPEALKSMPVLDRIIEETLRVVSNSMLIRQVIGSKNIQIGWTNPTETGNASHPAQPPAGWSVKRSDYVVYVPPLEHWSEDVVGPNPHRFQYDRVLTVGQKTFDRQIRSFGAGEYMCPGRNLARSEIKSIVASILRTHIVSAPAGFTPPLIPSHRQGRWGLGVTPPAEDVQLTFTRRVVE